MSKKVFLNNCNCNFNPCCCDKVTPTTTCIPLPSPPCIQVCDEYVDPACIIYSGDDVECYGIKKGDTIAQIFSLIFEKLDLLNCSCDYGSSVIQNITTTTSTTTASTTTSTTSTSTSSTTTTTTIAPLSLCFTLSSEILSGDVNYILEQLIIEPSTTLINGKHYYEFYYAQFDFTYKIYWDGTKWVLIIVDYPNTIIATLNNNGEYPIGDLFNSWVIDPINSDYVFVTTRTSCVNSIILFYDQIGFSKKCYRLDSYWNSVDSIPSSTGNKPVFINVVTGATIRAIWNSFTNGYELYNNYPNDIIAITSNTNALDPNWIIHPSFISTYEKIATSYSNLCKD